MDLMMTYFCLVFSFCGLLISLFCFAKILSFMRIGSKLAALTRFVQEDEFNV